MNTDPLEYVDPGTAFSLVGMLYLLMAIAAGIHVVLNKQNEAAAFSWLGIIVLAPLVGATLYWLFGINRIRRRAQAEMPHHTVTATSTRKQHDALQKAVDIDRMPRPWQQQMRLGLGVHQSPYLADNAVHPLLNGDQAYPEMIGAIENARQCVVLSSYIFEYDKIGTQFIDALVAAHNRGVFVRVMIDGLGVGYGFSLVRSDRVLRRQGVKTARFLSALSTTGTRFINLRNHRKILSVDGTVAFVGGINIRDSNLLGLATHSADSRHSEMTQDVHFKIEGPVINQINAVFSADWQFAAGETLALPQWQGHSGLAVTARVLLDGPDDNYQKLQLTMLGAIQSAQQRVLIVSPYFLPGKVLLSALQLAVLRGVRVCVCVPRQNNLAFVGWAMRANQSQLVEHGVQLFESPAPFDHSKLFLVDNHWSMIGSSNWDARSLELNFEINLECYDTTLNQQIYAIIEHKLQQSVRVSESPDEHFVKRLRNNFFRLFSPYL